MRFGLFIAWKQNTVRRLCTHRPTGRIPGPRGHSRESNCIYPSSIRCFRLPMNYAGIREMPLAQPRPERDSKISRPNFSGPTPENLSMNNFEPLSSFTKLPPFYRVQLFLLLISSFPLTMPASWSGSSPPHSIIAHFWRGFLLTAERASACHLKKLFGSMLSWIQFGFRGNHAI
jgi:hypothetical protein